MDFIKAFEDCKTLCKYTLIGNFITGKTKILMACL